MISDGIKPFVQKKNTQINDFALILVLRLFI